MSKRVATVLVLAAAAWVAIAPPVLAQRFTASIRGQVTSADTGAVLAGATVTAENTDTGLVRTLQANPEGNFNFGDLPVGTYTVTVEFTDFKTAVVEKVTLNVADTRQLDFAMEIGAMEDSVTVVAPSLVVETIGGEVASTISGKEVRELPLNGRNFTQLTQLMPGVSAPDGLDYKNKGLLSGVDTSVSGSTATGNAWAIDGANNNDVGSNRTIVIYPSIEAIEEFKVHRNSYGPEFGGAGGSQINLVTKSGTNLYKGSAFAFFRSDSLNEKNFFLEEQGLEKEELERSDVGFTLGGPILRNKLHFFVSTELNDETRGTVRSAVVPTLEERQGNFSAAVPGCTGAAPIDPLTGQAFPGNTIPGDRLSPGGLALLGLYPTPNATPTAGNCANWVGTVPTDIEWQQINARLDWSVNDSTRALLRYTRDNWENPAPNAGAANGLWGDDPFPAVDSSWEQPGESLVLQLNNVFGSNVVNTATFSISGNEITTGREAGGLNAQINAAIPPFFSDDDKLNDGSVRAHPVYWGGATGQDLWTQGPWENQQDLLVFKDDYQQVFGDHLLKAGILYSSNEKAEACCGSSGFESPHFWGGAGIGGWGATSGNRIADILIRDMYHGYDETAFQPSPTLEWQDLEIYVGDSWKAAENLSIDYGVRYSRFFEPEAQQNNIAAFDPALFDPALGNAACNGIAQVPGTNPCGDAGLIGGADGVSASFVEGDSNNFAPRLGMAWDVFGTGNSVLRAGFGQYFQRERVNIQLDFGGQPPFTRNTSGIRPLDSADPQFLAPGFGVPNRGINASNETPYNLQYNVTWEQRLAGNTTLEIGYVGNRGKHLVNKYDVNQVGPGDSDGNGVSDRLDFVRGTGDGNGNVRPFFTGGANRILYWDNNGESKYDSLQTQLQTRWGAGSLAQMSYTWSKFRANTSVASSSAGEENVQATDISNFDLDWGLADLHREHIFNASVVWNLPLFEGQGGVKEHLLGNWTIAGVLGYSTGTPITPYVTSVAGLGGGGFAGTGYAGNNRPLRVPGVSCNGSGAQIINPGAFTLDGALLGDTSQFAERGSCEGPDYFQIDLSFYKRIPLGKRFTTELRFEIFNVTNRDNFIAASVVNSINVGNVVLDAPLDQATQIISAEFPGNFGQAQAVRDPRQVQLGLKLSF